MFSLLSACKNTSCFPFANKQTLCGGGGEGNGASPCLPELPFVCFLGLAGVFILGPSSLQSPTVDAMGNHCLLVFTGESSETRVS